MDVPKKLLIIGNENEFFIRGLATAVAEHHFDICFANADIDSISKADKEIKVFTLFLNDTIEEEEIFIYLKDLIVDRGIRLCIVGNPESLEIAKKELLEENVAISFERPINVREIAKGVLSLWETAQKQAQKKTILLVDDDPVFMKRMRTILFPYYRVYMVNSGVSAIVLLAKHHVDLILLDYDMPVASGPQVLEMIHDEKDFQDIPVIFLTGISDPTSVATALKMKPVNYILKTEPAQYLLDKLQSFFESVKMG